MGSLQALVGPGHLVFQSASVGIELPTDLRRVKGAGLRMLRGYVNIGWRDRVLQGGLPCGPDARRFRTARPASVIGSTALVQEAGLGINQALLVVSNDSCSRSHCLLF